MRTYFSLVHTNSHVPHPDARTWSQGSVHACTGKSTEIGALVTYYFHVMDRLMPRKKLPDHA